MSELIYGKNAVCEALRAGRRRFKRVLVAETTRESETLRTIRTLAHERDVPLGSLDPRGAGSTPLRGVNHQGVALETSDYPYVEIETCLAAADQQNEAALLLLLDHVQDPQNVGTLLRTAEVVGVHGVALPRRRAATITPAVVNASSGATEHLHIALVGNLAKTMQSLQREGVMVVGVEDDERARVFDQVDLSMPLALVVGAEGPGLARLTRERCDFLIRLPMRGQIASLNVAVASSIILYHTWRQRDPQQHPPQRQVGQQEQPRKKQQNPGVARGQKWTSEQYNRKERGGGGQPAQGRPDRHHRQ